MVRFLARRLALTLPVLIGVATLVFSLIHLIPGDPPQAMLGEGAPQADVEELRRRLGLDRPLIQQYGAFLVGLTRGDLGTSLRTGLPVTSQILERMPATLELAARRHARVDSGTIRTISGVFAPWFTECRLCGPVRPPAQRGLPYARHSAPQKSYPQYRSRWSCGRPWRTTACSISRTHARDTVHAELWEDYLERA